MDLFYFSKDRWNSACLKSEKNISYLKNMIWKTLKRYSSNKNYLFDAYNVLLNNNNLLEICNKIDILSEHHKVEYKLNNKTLLKNRILHKIDSILSENYNINVLENKGIQAYIGDQIKVDVHIKSQFLNKIVNVDIKTKHGNQPYNNNSELTIRAYDREHLESNVDFLIFNASYVKNNNVIYQSLGAIKTDNFFKKAISRKAGQIITIGREQKTLMKDDYLLTVNQLDYSIDQFADYINKAPKTQLEIF